MIFFLDRKKASNFELKYTDVWTTGVTERAAIQYCFDDQYKSKRIIKA